MGKFLKVQNLETFEEMLRNKDLKISKVIVETALKNLFNNE